jgi:hypothetical protein
MPFLSVLTLLTCFEWSLPPASQPASAAAEITWLGLYSDDLTGWLQNEGRLAELCTAQEHSQEWHDCREAKLQPLLELIPVHAEPRATSRRLGEVVIVAIPGKGMNVFASAVDGKPTPFTPDLYDPDWGYGSWFHQTVLERRGPWFRLALPHIGAGWLDLRRYGEQEVADRVRRLEAGHIVSIPDGDMVFLGIDDGAVRFRPEQDADMWCKEGDPPALSPWQERRIPVERLRDADGRLRMRYKYTRGC